MALRCVFFSSPTTYFSAETQQISFKPLSSPQCHSFSLSRSLPLVSPLSLSLPAKCRRECNFQTHFSSSAVESPPESLSGESAELELEERLKNRLYAQNVPWDCTAEDIRTIFEKYGTVEDVELSMYNKTRNRGLAFVTMGSPEEALVALNNLQSYEMNGRVIRIDYAKPRTKKVTPPPEPKPEVTFNLFVANLSFEARAKDLKEFFISEGHNVVSAEIIFHENPRRSMGYGFVAFKSRKEAEAALAAVQGKVFMGRPIRVARSKQFVKQPTPESAKSEDLTTESDSGAKQEEAAEAEVEVAEAEVEVAEEADAEAAEGN